MSVLHLYQHFGGHALCGTAISAKDKQAWKIFQTLECIEHSMFSLRKRRVLCIPCNHNWACVYHFAEQYKSFTTSGFTLSTSNLTTSLSYRLHVTQPPVPSHLNSASHLSLPSSHKQLLNYVHTHTVSTWQKYLHSKASQEAP